MRGWCRMPQAMFSRRRMPPENCLTGSRARSASPVRSSAQSICLRELRSGQSLQPAEPVEVLARRQQRIERELLRHDAELARRAAGHDRLIEDANLAAVEPDPSGDRANQRGLARAVRTEQRQQLPLAQLEGRAVERLDGAVALPGVGDGQDVHRGYVLRSRCAGNARRSGERRQAGGGRGQVELGRSGPGRRASGTRGRPGRIRLRPGCLRWPPDAPLRRPH